MLERLLRKWFGFVERVTRPNVMNMTQEEFDKLTERDKKDIRGDVPKWETEWIEDTSHAKEKLEIFHSISRNWIMRLFPMLAARMTMKVFVRLFNKPREQRYL